MESHQKDESDTLIFSGLTGVGLDAGFYQKECRMTFAYRLATLKL